MANDCRCESGGVAALNRLRIRGLLAVLLIAVCTRVPALDPIAAAEPVRSRQLADSGGTAADLRSSDRAHPGRLPVGRHPGGTGALRWRSVHGVRQQQRTRHPEQVHHRSCSSTGPGACGLEHGRASRYSRTGASSRCRQIAGLAHAYVRAITEGGAGRLWVGTENGLFEVDGASARPFDASSGLRDSRIRALHEDRGGAAVGRHGSGAAAL